MGKRDFKSLVSSGLVGGIKMFFLLLRISRMCLHCVITCVSVFSLFFAWRHLNSLCTLESKMVEQKRASPPQVQTGRESGRI